MFHIITPLLLLLLLVLLLLLLLLLLINATQHDGASGTKQLEDGAHQPCYSSLSSKLEQ